MRVCTHFKWNIVNATYIYSIIFYFILLFAVPESNAEKDLATGLEWNDPLHVNIIERPEDRRKLCLILIKIAQILHLPLLPYFQDYELVSFITQLQITVKNFHIFFFLFRFPAMKALLPWRISFVFYVL